MNFEPGPGLRKSDGFTLVEIMIVVAIIAVLAAVAVASFSKARRESRITAFVNDMRIATDAFNLYVMEHNGVYPPDVTPSVMPAGMSDYLRKMRWAETTPVGGQWDWDLDQFGFKAGVSVYRPTMGDVEMTRVDHKCDDGDLATGMFRKRADGYISIIEFLP